MEERKEKWRYASKPDAKDGSCYLHLTVEEGGKISPTYEFKAYPRRQKNMYVLFPADKLTARKYPALNQVSMDLVREYR